MVIVNPGSLLIAPPTFPDNCFSETVHLVTHHTKGGTFALCVNQATDLTLKEVLVDLNINSDINFPMYWGGPVDPTSIWMLHDSDWHCGSTIKFHKDWAMTSNQEMLRRMADGDVPNYFRLMYGSCSWGRGQLEAELAGTGPWSPRTSWLVADSPDPRWLMEEPVEDLWHTSTMLSAHQAVNKWI
jgi:putative transcriptional regulator